MIAPTSERPYDEVGAIISYEQGDLSARATVELFAHLIRTGRAWTLQGHYGRTAAAMIAGDIIDKQGNVTDKALDALDEDEAGAEWDAGAD